MINTNLALVFPGQGSQSLGMLADIATQFSEVSATFAEASEALGYDLWKLCQAGSSEELDKTFHAQPALLTASIAVWRILQKYSKIKPALLAGHSLGEYTALVCANTLQFVDAVKLVAARGHYMQDAVPAGVGAMAAIIGLDEASVHSICEQAIQDTQQVLAPANFNSIGQIVIAGHKAAVERGIHLAKAQGAKLAVVLPVTVPSHCELMVPAAERLAALLQTISLQPTQIPVLNNVAGTRYTTIDSIRAGLIAQLSQPVRWVETIQVFRQQNITTIIECGPGKVLTGLIKRIDKNLQLITTSDISNLEITLKLEDERSA